MPATILDELQKGQLRSTMLEMLSGEVERLREQHRRELLEECREAALEQARRDLDEELKHRTQKILDQQAAYEDNVDREIEARVEVGVEKGVAAYRDEIDGRLVDLKDRLAASEEALNDSNLALIDLLTALFPLNQKCFPNRRLIAENLPIMEINKVLARHGIALEVKTVAGCERTFRYVDAEGIEKQAAMVALRESK